MINLLGIRDLNKVDMNTSLSNLGMDSIMATTIKQTLENEFNLVTSYRDLRRQTLAEYTKRHNNTYKQYR